MAYEVNESITTEKKKRHRFDATQYNTSERYINLLIPKTKADVTQ